MSIGDPNFKGARSGKKIQFMIDKTKFSLDKIIEISCEDYLKSIGRRAVDYNFKGLSLEGEAAHMLTDRFKELIPENAVAVVGVRRHFYKDIDGTTEIANMYGTALIPKVN